MGSKQHFIQAAILRKWSSDGKHVGFFKIKNDELIEKKRVNIKNSEEVLWIDKYPDELELQMSRFEGVYIELINKIDEQSPNVEITHKEAMILKLYSFFTLQRNKITLKNFKNRYSGNDLFNLIMDGVNQEEFYIESLWKVMDYFDRIINNREIYTFRDNYYSFPYSEIRQNPNFPYLEKPIICIEEMIEECLDNGIFLTKIPEMLPLTDLSPETVFQNEICIKFIPILPDLLMTMVASASVENIISASNKSGVNYMASTLSSHVDERYKGIDTNGVEKIHVTRRYNYEAIMSMYCGSITGASMIKNVYFLSGSTYDMITNIFDKSKDFISDRNHFNGITIKHSLSSFKLKINEFKEGE